MTALFLDKILEPIDLWGFSADTLVLLLMRLLVNLLVTTGIIRFFYYPRTQRRDYFFSFVLTSSTIFMLLFLLDTVKIQVGFALGLFAIFGILRYRTDALPIREMTYLFMIIGVSVINALAKHVSYPELLVINLVFVVVTWVMESNRVLKHVAQKDIVYENIELIKPDRYNELMSDLVERTGIPIERVEIGRIDFLKDTALLHVFYRSKHLSPVNNSFTLFGDDEDV